ncbi:DUF4197 domain-containing protein [Erythrobacter sp. SCSIO 43205]|uniref:DUF4197 domain-containing protein n=1 Tax=Erythrobacter sp. SCSIO 43205 TaxID=2779361 RepID=UPI001CA9EA25|nr:DUF4197 domain-containing protein [Erythrobacter sp. SCSIO 43205]UAB77711.1 DUF4197 domain-containing protein [Erythrobacter sp. SCSIO 43205]
MHKTTQHPLARRQFIGGGLALSAALTLPACAGGYGISLTEAVRRLLLLSSENAFARLTADGGFWDSQVAQLGLGDMLGSRGNVLTRVLTSALVKDQLEDAFADFAVDASFKAAPIVTEAVRTIGFANAVELVRGGPNAATAALRGELGGRLVDEMVPELGQAIRIASNPGVAELLRQVSGADIGAIAQGFAGNIDDAIWTEIGKEEAIIRANPQSTNDPLLIGVFGLGRSL